jgi:streptogramin lyase
MIGSTRDRTARARRRPADRVRARPRLEGLEDRCLLSPTITEFPLPTASDAPYWITAGPDGNLWFTTGGGIGMINPATHAIAQFPVPTASAGPHQITAGPDGNLWFTEINAGQLGEINPATHAISEFAIPTTTNASIDPGAITAGPDGNLWFAEGAGNNIGMINPATHAITVFPIPTANAYPFGITAGPDGNVWFAEGAGYIGMINPATHAISEFPVPTPTSYPLAITAGPDGNLWFTENGNANGNPIGMINPATHAISVFPVPTVAYLRGISGGPDGNVWFTEAAPGHNIAMINPATDVITEYPIPYANAGPYGITAGPDGNVWFADRWSPGIGVVTLTTNAAHFVVTTQPPSSLTAGSPFGLTVQAEDSSGNLDSSFNGTVTVALANNPGGATLGGTLTATASGGAATFSGLTLTRAASGYTLQVSSNGLTAATTSAITVTPAAASQVAIAQQPPATITAGSPFAVGVVIEDPYGNVETGESGTLTVSLASGPAGATLGGTTSVAASQGVATFSALTLTAAASGYSLEIASGPLSATTTTIAVTPAAPAELIPTSEPPGTLTAGGTFGLIIGVEDPYGNPTTISGGVSLAIATGPTGATLGGQTTATASGGVATFTGLTLTRAGNYMLQASGVGLPPVPIGPITVTPAAPSQLGVTAPPPDPVIAGIGFGLAVSAEDAYGNPTPSLSGQVTVATTGISGSGTLGGTTTVSPSGGIALFSGLVLDLAGTYGLQVSSAGLGSAAVGTITVAPAAASQIIVMTQPPGSLTAGAGFGFQVEAEDPYGNLATGFDGLLTAALSVNDSNATLAGPVTAVASQGVASFAGLAVERAGSGYTVQVTGNGLAGATTSAFDVTPAAAAQLVISAPPPASVTAGQPFGFSVAAVDLYGNAVTSVSGGVTIVLSKHPAQGVLDGATTATMSGGLATFSGLSLDTAASDYMIATTSGSLSGATTASITVVPAAPAKLVVSVPPPTTMTAGAGFGLAIAAEDRYGNPTTGLTGAVTIALADDPTGATLAGPLTATATGGVANFAPVLTLDTAGTGYTIQASAAGLAPVITGPITVVAAPATQLVVLTQPPSSPAPGSAFGMTVAAEDAYGNVDPNFAGPVTVALPSGSGAALGETTSVAASRGVATFAGLTLNGASTAVSLQVIGSGLTGTTTVPITSSASNAGAGPGSGGGPGSPSPTGAGGGPTSTPSAPAVAMTGIQVVQNRKRRAIEVLIRFGGAPDPAEAASVAEYQLIVAGRRGSFAGKGAKPIGLRSAGYDPSKNTVALIPRKPFGLERPVQVAVDFVRGPLFVIRRPSNHRV